MRPPHTSTRWLDRSIVAVVSVLAALTCLAAPAFAHVEAAATSTSANGTTTIAFSFNHGCKGSPTTGLKVKIPDGVSTVVPQDAPGFTSQVSESTFGWTGGSVPDGTAATFNVNVTISAAAGTVLYFPTLQTCAAGENAWIEIPAAGQPEPEYVAPSITVDQTTGAHAAGDGVSTAPTSAVATTPSTPQATTNTTAASDTTEVAAGESGSSDHSAAVVVVVSVVVVAAGALVLYLRRRTPAP